MSVYMGEEGSLVIERTTANQGRLKSLLDPDDVNVSRKRFSFDFPVEAINTGDHLEIYTLDGSDLVLVDGHNFPDGYWYCNVDDTGGIRLYDRFDDAINGTFEKALTLAAPIVSQQIVVQTRNSNFRCIAQMRSWEITTKRENVDITSLGEEFQSYFSRGLISGQGSIDCIWDYKNGICDNVGSNSVEQPQYLCELLLRLQQGALFRGRFYLYAGLPSVWYESDCIVTNVGLNFAPGEVVGSRVDFIATGPIQLHTGSPEGFLAQEDLGLILQEDRSKIALQDQS